MKKKYGKRISVLLISFLLAFGSLTMAEESVQDTAEIQKPAVEVVAQEAVQEGTVETEAADQTQEVPAAGEAAPQPETEAAQAPQPETEAPQPETAAPQPETVAPQPETAAAQAETIAVAQNEAASQVPAAAQSTPDASVQPTTQAAQAAQPSTQAAQPAQQSTAAPQAAAQSTATQPTTAAQPETTAAAEEKQPIVLDIVPVECKTEMPESFTANECYGIVLEIRNVTDHCLENLALTLRSNESGFLVTPFKDEQEAQTNLQYVSSYDEYILRTPEMDREELEERTIRISQLSQGQTVKIKVVLLTKQDFVPDIRGLDTKVKCEFAEGEYTFTSEGTTRLMAKEKEKSVVEPEAPTADPENPVEENVEDNTPIEEDPNQSGEKEKSVSTDDPAAGEEAAGESEDADSEGEESGENEAADGKFAEGESSAEKTPAAGEETAAEGEGVTNEVENIAADGETEQTASEQEGLNMEENKSINIESDEIEEFTIIDDGSEEETEEEYYDDYYYEDWGTYYSDSYYEGVQISTATPYILIQSYSHKKTISTGDTFLLEVDFLNTSQKTAMEGVVIKVTTSEGLTLENGTNTMFINNIAAGATDSVTLKLAAASECKDKSQKVDFAISYEYIANNERKQGTSEESVYLPVSQKDRLELQDPKIDTMELGQEGVISIPYVNKGYTSLYNMEAVLDIENADAVESSIYAGNIESGKSGTLDFLVTPFEEGDYSGTVTLSYEDSAQKDVSVVIPLEFTTVASYVEDDWGAEEMAFEEEMTEEAGGSNLSLYLIIGGAVLVVAVIIAAILIRKKKKTKAADDPDIEDWLKGLNENGEKKS